MGKTNDDTDLMVKTVAEVEATPQGIVRRWLAEIAMADAEEKDWRKEGKDIYDLYEGEKAKANSFNILWSNTEIMTAAVYNSTPQPDVRRRFRDKDPLGKAVSTVIERSLSYEIDDYEFDAAISDAVLDVCLVGRGLVRIKYEPKFSALAGPEQNAAQGDPGNEPPAEAAPPQEQLIDEHVPCEHVDWMKFRRGPGKRWPEVPWISFDHDLSYDMALEKFGSKIADKLKYENSEMEKQDWSGDRAEKEARTIFKTCLVHEIWDRDQRRALFIAPSYKESPCLIAEDPLRLKGFFPIPRPVYAIPNSCTLIPKPLYRMYKQQALELDRVSARINKIVDAMKVRGIYASNLPEVAGVIGSVDNEMTPIANAAEIAAMGGLDKAIWLMPVDKLVQVLNGLYQARNEIKQAIYEITGLGDILRGASDPKETASAQRIKSQWGSLRIQKMQREVQRLVRDVMRLKAEVISERFSQQTLATITNVQLPMAAQKQQAQIAMQKAQATGQQPPPEVEQILSQPSWEEVMQVLRSDGLRNCRVDIETDSTVAETLDRDMAGLAEIATALGGVLQAVAQGLPLDTAKEIALAIARRARLGNAVEDALENMPNQGDQMQQFAQQIMQMIQQQSQQGAQQIAQNDKQQAGLQQYDQAIQQTLGGVNQAAQVTVQAAQQSAQQSAAVGQTAQATQQMLAQLGQLVQQIAEGNAVREQQAQQAMQQVGEAVQGMVGVVQQVTQGLQAVLQSLNTPKQITFERGKDGRVSGATATMQ